MNLQTILALLSGAAKMAGNLGVPVVGLVGSLIPILNELIASIQSHTGKTREQIISETGVEIDAELAALMESDAKGE